MNKCRMQRFANPFQPRFNCYKYGIANVQSDERYCFFFFFAAYRIYCGGPQKYTGRHPTKAPIHPPANTHEVAGRHLCLVGWQEEGRRTGSCSLHRGPAKKRKQTKKKENKRSMSDEEFKNCTFNLMGVLCRLSKNEVEQKLGKVQYNKAQTHLYRMQHIVSRDSVLHLGPKHSFVRLLRT